MEDKKVIELSRKKRYLAVVDDKTGKTCYYKLPERTLGKGWHAMYDAGAVWLAKQNLPNEQYRVLLYLTGTLDFDNWISAPQKQIAKELNMKQPAVARAIKGLISHDILQEGPRGGLYKTYRFNPHIGHKGKDVSRTVVEYEELKRRKEQQQSEE